MTRSVIRWLVLCLPVLALAPAALTQTYQIFQPFDGLNSCAVGINPSGEIVGWYQEIITTTPLRVKQHSYLLSKGHLTSFDPKEPALAGSLAARINPRGDIVGWWWDTPGINTGYLMTGGVHINIVIPGANHTYATGINAQGDVVGYFIVVQASPNPSVYRSYQRTRHGVIEPMEIPDPTATAVRAWGINSRGDIVGQYVNPGGTHGFLKRSSGEFLVLDPADMAVTNGWTRAIGINEEGTVSGDYLARVGTGTKTLGFLWRDGVFTTYDIPNTTSTAPREINPSGWVVGCAGVTNAAPPPATRNCSFIRSPR